MKRRFIYAPAWVDYTYQLTQAVDYALSGLVSRLTGWRYEFLDRHCKCERCLERKKQLVRPIGSES